MTPSLLFGAVIAALVAVLLSQGEAPGQLGRAELAFKQRARERGRDLTQVPLGVLWIVSVASLALLAGASTLGTRAIVPVSVTIGAGLLVPPVVDFIWAALHERRLASVLPDSLRQLSSILAAGGTVDHALQQVARVAPEPARTELVRISQARMLRVGILGTCARRRADRLPSATLHDLASVLDAGSRTGAPIAGLLLDLAEELESRNRFRNAMRSTLRGPIFALVFVSVAVWAFALATPAVFGMIGGRTEPLSPAAQGALLIATVVPWVAVAWVTRRDALLE